MQGDGGAGSPNDITGSNVTYAGGGGGKRSYTPGSGIAVPVGGTGGAGGGGAGGAQGAPTGSPSSINTAAVAGTVNLGGGGGGGQNNHAGGSGGSGIVVIKETTPKCASGVWNINEHFDNVKASTWI